ncbi:hypothetical protein SEVIR_5G369301v4 [Setaria viridis]
MPGGDCSTPTPNNDDDFVDPDTLCMAAIASRGLPWSAASGGLVLRRGKPHAQICPSDGARGPRGCRRGRALRIASAVAAGSVRVLTDDTTGPFAMLSRVRIINGARGADKPNHHHGHRGHCWFSPCRHGEISKQKSIARTRRTIELRFSPCRDREPQLGLGFDGTR